MIFGKPPDHLIKVATLIEDFWRLWVQEAPPHAKQRREDDGTERSTDRQAERSCKQQNNGTATEPVTLLANEAKAEKKGKSFQYVCPACQKSTNGPGRSPARMW